MRKVKKEEISKIISTQLMRSAFREVIEETLYKKYAFHRHPAFIIFISFILSGGIGTGISYYVKSIEKKEFLKQQAFEHLNSFNKDLMARRIEAGYLRMAFMRHVPIEEIKIKKSNYDKAVKQWRENYLSHQFSFRKYFRSKYSTYIEKSMEKHLIKNLLLEIDKEITTYYDEYIKNYPNPIPFEEEKMKLLGKLLNTSNRCGVGFANQIFDLIYRDIKFDSSYEWNFMKEDFKNTTLKTECKIP